MRLQKVENTFLKMIKYGNLYLMEEVMVREVAYDRGNMSKYHESLVSMAQ